MPQGFHGLSCGLSCFCIDDFIYATSPIWLSRQQVMMCFVRFQYVNAFEHWVGGSQGRSLSKRVGFFLLVHELD